MYERIKADLRVWLVDDKKRVIAHATVSRCTSELEVTCKGVTYRRARGPRPGSTRRPPV